MAKSNKAKSATPTTPETAPTPPPFTGNPKSMQDALLDALEHLQKQDNPDMRTWARENPTEFYKMAARLLPEYNSETSDALAPITQIEIIHTYEDKRQQDIA
jgi:hypothetical protein